MTAYRVRLDTTTNWAVATTAGMVSYALGTPSAPHFVLVLSVVLNLLFAWIEARRYCSFELIRQRVRLMERGFYAEVLGGEATSGWQHELRRSCATPVLPVRLPMALGVRLRRNYLGLVTVVMLAWVLKLILHGRAGFLASAHVAGVPGGVVLAGAGIFLAVLAAMALRHQAPEEG